MCGHVYSIISCFRTTHGFKRYALSSLLGFISVLALPPFFVAILLIPTLSLLLLQITTSLTKKEAFLTGWSFGFGYFLAGLYWIAISLLVDPDQFAWLIPFATFGIAGILAITFGVVTLITWLTPVYGWRKVMVFAACWVVVEWLRGHLLTGFPWNLIGYSLAFSGSLIQLAAVTGIYGISLFTVLLTAMPYTMLEDKSRWKPVVCAMVMGVVWWVGGAVRLHDAKPTPRTTPIRIVQASIPQSLDMSQETMDNSLAQQLSLSRKPSFIAPELIVWPESAIPYELNLRPDVRMVIKSVVPPHGFLISGAMRSEGEGDKLKLWNSLVVINDKGSMVDSYDKVHLVPFGEYIPLRSLLPINKITAGSIDFSTGSGVQTLSAHGKIRPFSPLICYEAIFPGAVVNKASPPLWIVNVTNDAWFGNSSGPYQHLTMVRLRAVEQGLPLVRAANTGVSAIVDSYGMVVSSLGLGEKGVLDGFLPLPTAPTPYSKLGDIVLFVLLGLHFIIIIFPSSARENYSLIKKGCFFLNK